MNSPILLVKKIHGWPIQAHRHSFLPVAILTTGIWGDLFISAAQTVPTWAQAAGTIFAGVARFVDGLAQNVGETVVTNQL
jgi:hypothetical protein